MPRKWQFQQRVRKYFPGWYSASDFPMSWNNVKEFIGWKRWKRTGKPGSCGLLHIVSIAKAYGFSGDHTGLSTLAMKLLWAAFILCGKDFTARKKDLFAQHVDGIGLLWQSIFGRKGPVCLHILQIHWKQWMQHIKPYAVRTEGGERLNGPHAKAWRTATTKYTPVFHQRPVPGPAGVPWVPRLQHPPRDGLDTLLEMQAADWWVCRKKLLGGWPNW